MAAGTGHGHAQPFPVWQFPCCLCDFAECDFETGSMSPKPLLVSELPGPSSMDPTEPRNCQCCGFLTAQPQTQTPRTPARAGIRNSQRPLENDISTAGISTAREGSASHHGRSQLGKRWRAVGTSRVSRHTRHIPRKIHALVRYLVCSSLGPAGLRGTASDGSLLLGAILEGAHRQAGRLLWCWRPRWVHVSRGRRHLGDVGAGLSPSRWSRQRAGTPHRSHSSDAARHPSAVIRPNCANHRPARRETSCPAPALTQPARLTADDSMVLAQKRTVIIVPTGCTGRWRSPGPARAGI